MFAKLPGALRAHVVAPESRRIGNLIVDRGWEGSEAKERLRELDAEQAVLKKKRFGKDPFTGEDKWFAAKPASVRLKVRPLKKLKDAAL